MSEPMDAIDKSAVDKIPDSLLLHELTTNISNLKNAADPPPIPAEEGEIFSKPTPELRTEDEKKGPRSDFPDIPEIVGDFGAWQKRIFALIFLSFVICVWQDMSITFLAPNIDFWCVSQASMNGSFNITYAQNKDQSVLLSNVAASMNQTRTLERCEVTDINNQTVPCTKWEYDLSLHTRTIVSDWNLVCDRAWLVSFSKSVYMIGYMTSILFMGQISDWFGRYPVITCSYVIMTTVAILSSFSSSYLMFVILRFFGGFGRTGVTTTGFVILMEIVGPKRRADLGFGVQLAWSTGYVILPGIAWLIKEWVYLQLTLALALLFLVFLFWVIPESPRWLLTQSKKNEFEKLVTDSAKKNAHGIAEDMKNSMAEYWKRQETETKVKKKSLLDVVKTKHLRLKLLALLYIWVVNSFVYYGLSFNTNRLAGNPYLNFFLSGIVEFPAVGGFMYAVKFFGRKKTLSAGMITVGIFCACLIAVPADMQWLTILFAMIAKLCITGTYQTAYICTAELFPTVVRSVTIGACSTFARLGPILAPFLRDLGHATQEFVPDLLNAILTITAGILVLTLPETKDRIPDTLEDGKDS